MPTIVLCGGGTAGHVIPNLALLPELRKKFDTIVYFGGNGMEKNLAREAGLPFYETPVIKFDRGRLFENAKIPFVLSQGIKKATAFFDEIKPDIVFSKGGYAALPACFAAKRKHIPVICHESDYSLGLSNRIVKTFASAVLTSFPETKGGAYVGNPVREEIVKKVPSSPPFPDMDSAKKIILITGGSLGAVRLNEVVIAALPELTKKYEIIHISGKNCNFTTRMKGYHRLEYANNFPALLAYADLVLCRSGSNTLTETAALGKRCITVPLPKGASRGDQLLNAQSFEKRGFCKVLPQENLSKESLLPAIEESWLITPPTLNVSEVNRKIVSVISSFL